MANENRLSFGDRVALFVDDYFWLVIAIVFVVGMALSYPALVLGVTIGTALHAPDLGVRLTIVATLLVVWAIYGAFLVWGGVWASNRADKAAWKRVA